MIRSRTPRRTRGFTVLEMLVVVLLGTVVVLGLYRVLTSQQRAYRQQNLVAGLHDALRVAAAVLAADLREASAGGGDLAVLATDSVVVRSPVGFAIVCALDTTNRRLGLINVRGRLDASTGDSLLVYHPAGWIVRDLLAVDPSGFPPLSCPYASGPVLERTVQVGASVTGVPVGAPARAFHRYTYGLEQEANLWWLARTDGTATELLAGPFWGSGLQFVYLDTLGQTTATASQVARVQVDLIARAAAASAGLAGSGAPIRDTLGLAVGLRNR